MDQEFMVEVFAQSKRFFDLPMEEKMKVLRNEKHRGYTPILDETLDPDNQMHGDYKEGFYIGVEVPEDEQKEEKPFYGPNMWPSADLLPGWRQTMEKYHQKSLFEHNITIRYRYNEVAKAVARIIALALDLDGDFFDKAEMLGEPIATLRLLHYEGVRHNTGKASNPANGIFGAGAHSDYGLITLLATDDVMGLQICRDKDATPQIWEYVAPVKGSTLHRVLIDGQERYSIAYFVEPSHECLVECLPTCKSEKNPPNEKQVPTGPRLQHAIGECCSAAFVVSGEIKRNKEKLEQQDKNKSPYDD
ncbi:hypothetical protein ACLOJK_040128 [Asimina triloba]